MFGTIGEVPTFDVESGAYRFQYKALPNPADDKQLNIKIASLASRNSSIDNLSLYLTVTATTAASGVGVEFELYLLKGSIPTGARYIVEMDR